MRLLNLILPIFAVSSFAFASVKECKNFSGTWDSIDNGCPGSHLIVQTGCSATDTISFGDDFLTPLNGVEVKRWPGAEEFLSATLDRNGDLVYRTRTISVIEDWTLQFDENKPDIINTGNTLYDSNGQNPRETWGCSYKRRN